MATASDIEDPILIYQWDFGDGSGLLSTEESPRYNYTAKGTYTVTVTVTDSDGGSATDTISIIIPEIGAGDGGDGGDGEDGTGEPGEKDEEEDLMQWLSLLIIIILVGVILLLLFNRKKPGEGLPEEAEPEGEPSEDIDLKDTQELSVEEESLSEVEDKELDELPESPAIPPTTYEETIEENSSEEM
jgi:PKD repeat protein